MLVSAVYITTNSITALLGVLSGLTRDNVVLCKKPSIGPPDALFKPYGMTPAQAMHPRGILQFARCAVRFGWVKKQFSGKSNHPLHGFSQFADGDILAGTQVDEAGFGVTEQFFLDLVVRQLHQVQAAAGHVIDVEQFPAGGAAAPDHDLG